MRAAQAADRRWGWHPLDARWAATLVADAGIAPGDLVLDIGAGTGSLTAPLLDAGARVIAFELHHGRASELRRRFGRSVKVIEVDAADLRLPRRPFRVVANPPWGISAAVVKRLTANGSRLERADLVLPRWSVQRWTGHRGAFALSPGRSLPTGAFAHRGPPAGVLVVRAATPRAGGR